MECPRIISVSPKRNNKKRRLPGQAAEGAGRRRASACGSLVGRPRRGRRSPPRPTSTTAATATIRHPSASRLTGGISPEQCGKTSAMGPVDSRRKDNRTAGQQAVPRKPKGKGGRAMGSSDAPKVPGTQSVGLSVRTAELNPFADALRGLFWLFRAVPHRVGRALRANLRRTLFLTRRARSPQSLPPDSSNSGSRRFKGCAHGASVMRDTSWKRPSSIEPSTGF